MKKALNITKKVFIWLLVVFSVAMIVFTLISVTTFDQNDRGIFGYRFFAVKTNSMAATDFKAGDIAIIKKLDSEGLAQLKEGDIISFISQNGESYGETITHKIRRLTTDAEGNPGFVTYGTTTDTDDETVVTYPYVIGQYKGRIACIGSFFLFLKTTPGFITCIFVPLTLLILYNGVKLIILFRRYKREQLESLEKERNEVEEEKKRSAEMMRKLEELQAQLRASGININNVETSAEMPESEAAAAAEGETEADGADK